MLYNYAEAVSLYGSDYLLKKAIKEKKIYKVDKGIYSDEKDNFTKYEVAIKKYPASFLVQDTALYVLGFIDQEPEVIHLGTARNALRITDKSIKQHFYSDFDREDMEGHYAEHILSKKNLKEKVLKNGNIIRILNFKALVYDLIRNKDSYSDDELIGILTRIEKCEYLKGFEYWDFEANFRRENKESILTPEIEDKLDDIRTAQMHLELWDDWD